MALPTITELKLYLRIQTTAEDTLLTLLMTQAEAMVQAHIGRPITAIARTFVEEARTITAYGVVTKLLVPVTPVDWSTLVVTDVDLTALVEDEDYRLGDIWTGEIHAMPGVSFGNGPYTLDAEVGLSVDPEYATRIEPAIGAAILDVAADLWHRRNPGATTESTGGGVSTTYTSDGLPARTAAMLAPFRVVRWA